MTKEEFRRWLADLMAPDMGPGEDLIFLNRDTPEEPWGMKVVTTSGEHTRTFLVEITQIEE